MRKAVSFLGMRTTAIAAALIAGLAYSPVQAQDAVKIGLLTTLSGPGSALGNEVRDGFKLAVAHTGGKMGGIPIELKIEDDHQDPQTARRAVERFLKRDKVDVITGVVFSNVLLPVLPEIFRDDTVYLSVNTGPKDYAGEKCDPRFFAVAWQNEDIPAAMGKFATEKGYKSVALIAPNYPGGRESLDGFKRLYKGTIADEVYTKLSQLDFSAELAQLRATKPDAVFLFLPGGLGVNFIKQMGAAGMDKEMAILTPGFSADVDTIQAVGNPMEGLYNASQWAADLKNPPNIKFVADFEKTYGRMPTMYAAQAYDTAMLIDSAVRKVKGKTDDKAAFRQALKDADFPSIRGDFKFNNNHYPIQDIYMRQVQRGADGKLQNKLVGTTLENHVDAFASQCKMPG